MRLVMGLTEKAWQTLTAYYAYQRGVLPIPADLVRASLVHSYWFKTRAGNPETPPPDLWSESMANSRRVKEWVATMFVYAANVSAVMVGPNRRNFSNELLDKTGAVGSGSADHGVDSVAGDDVPPHPHESYYQSDECLALPYGQDARSVAIPEPAPPDVATGGHGGSEAESEGGTPD